MLKKIQGVRKFTMLRGNANDELASIQLVNF